MKIQKIFWALTVAALPLGFAACSDDEDEDGGGTVTNTVQLDPGANKAVEGQYVTTQDGPKVNVNSTNTITVAVPKKPRKMMLSLTRAEEEEKVEYEYVVGSYVKNGDVYTITVGGALWGTVTISPKGDGKYDITIAPQGEEPIQAEAVKAQPVASGETTDNLCRTWKPFEVRIEVLKPGASSWIGKKASPDFEDVKKKVEEEGCDVDDDFGNGYELERVSFDNAGGFTIGFNQAKNPDAKPYVGTWYWRDQAAGALHYKWNDKDMGNSYLTGEAQVVFKTVDNTPECWLNLDSEIESNNNKGKYLVKLKVGMHEFK